MEVAGDLTDTLVRVGHDGLGGGEGLTDLQVPCKALIAQTYQHAGGAGLIHLQLIEEAATVNKVEAKSISVLFGRLGIANHNAGIGLMRRSTAAAGDALDTHADRRAVELTLANMRTGEGD